jgi:hypothetical protein
MTNTVKVTTTYKTNGAGTGQIVAKAAGKQRTVTYDDALSVDANHGAAAGTLLNVLLDDRAQSMLRHPSGGKRVTMERDNGRAVFGVTV